MTDLDERTTTPASYPAIGLFDYGPIQRTKGWVVGAGAAAAAAILVVGYLVTAGNAAPNTAGNAAPNTAGNAAPGDSAATVASTDSSSASASTQANINDQFGGVIDESRVNWDTSTSFVVRTDDGTFINYFSFQDRFDDLHQTIASGSTDGETWSPVELVGVPDGKLLAVENNHGLLVATVLRFPHGSTLAVSPDGLTWTPVTVPTPDTAEGWVFTVGASDAVQLPDGTTLVYGEQHTRPDFDAFGVDGEDICSHDVGVNGQGQTTVTVWYCDENDTVESFTIPGSLIADPEGMLWTVDANGTNPMVVASPEEGLTPTIGGLYATDDMAAALFTKQDDPSTTYRGTTLDAQTWDLENTGVSGHSFADLRADHDGTSYQVPSSDFGPARVQRSNDGGQTWTDTAPLNPTSLIRTISAGPAGVAIYAREDSSPVEPHPPDFSYVAADGTRLTGAIPWSSTTWVLTTPSGETYEYDLDASLLASGGPSRSDSNVIVEFSEDGIRVFTVLSPKDGSTLLTVSSSELDEATPTIRTRPVVPDEDPGDFATSSGVVYFSSDEGASWEVLARSESNSVSLAVGDDEVILNDEGLRRPTPLRVPVPSD